LERAHWRFIADLMDLVLLSRTYFWVAEFLHGKILIRHLDLLQLDWVKTLPPGIFDLILT
jgi:hypothetical protein